jgi:hypothetical protein
MSILIKRPAPRREVLRGLLGGAAVSMALPYLDIFLDETGTALASGAPMPLRFGTWFWSMGHTPNQAIGADPKELTFLEECKSLNPYKKWINYFGQFNSPLDGRPNHVHQAGWIVVRTGTAPVKSSDIPAPTLDVLVADHIGKGSRFRSLEMSCTGKAQDTFSARSTHARNASEVSPVALYARVFGPEFADPNKAEFKPDPDLMLQKSVLSAVEDQRKRFASKLGAADKARFDEYATSIRELEQQLALQSQKPAPADACKVPTAPQDGPLGLELPVAQANHAAMTKILTMALACNQTKVFNMAFNDALSFLRRPGTANTHHTLTHEEPIDDAVGYQREAFWFNCRVQEQLASFIDAFEKVREGDRSLLDNTLIFAHAETSFAKIHQVDNIPIMTIGTAGGRLKTGKHIVGNGDPVSRVGLTAMQVMGLPLARWGTGSLETSKTVTDVLV